MEDVLATRLEALEQLPEPSRKRGHREPGSGLKQHPAQSVIDTDDEPPPPSAPHRVDSLA